MIKKIIEYVEDEISGWEENTFDDNCDYPHHCEVSPYIFDVIYVIIFTELKNNKTYKEIHSIIEKIINNLLEDCSEFVVDSFIGEEEEEIEGFKDSI